MPVGLVNAVGAHRERGRWQVGTVATAGYVALALALHAQGSKESVPQYVAFYGVLAVCWTVGRWMRDRAAAEAELRHRTAEAAVAAERAAIARDLHDVVTHSVTAMVVQADAAGFLLPDAPEKAAGNLGSISATGRRALTELRTLLHVLDGAPEAGRVPAVGELADLVFCLRCLGPHGRGDAVPMSALRRGRLL